ncbi:endorhamnosidase, partial [Salmonella enterica subsp. enterica serovar Enteritidis]|nr:endorhamnosidase [Salmonella enterica subsp. enterica serovar Enteritidis]
MSSGCGDVLSLNDLQVAKKHQIFEAEVITGKQGGVAGGADIDYATNQVTGQTQKTLPAVLRDAGFSPASFNFTTGGTLGVNDADKAVLWPKEDGGDGNYYAWRGPLPKVIPAASTPLTTGGISDSAWVAFGDITFRAEADKKFKYSVKLSDFTTLQQLADAAVDSVLIDRDYTFSNNETVNFGGKTLTIDCKAKFIGDGMLMWEQLGEGSVVNQPHMQTQTTPYTVYRFDDDGNWVTNPSTVLASVAQRMDKGYKPNINDLDIWDSLPDYIKNQTAGATLRVMSGSNITINSPEATFGGYLFTLCNRILVKNPRNFIAWESGVTFENHHTSAWGYGNWVIGGEIKYGSGSAVLFIRNDGGDDHDGGVRDLISYRVGESGVKTYQNEIGGRSARNY